MIKVPDQEVLSLRVQTKKKHCQDNIDSTDSGPTPLMEQAVRSAHNHEITSEEPFAYSSLALPGPKALVCGFRTSSEQWPVRCPSSNQRGRPKTSLIRSLTCFRGVGAQP